MGAQWCEGAAPVTSLNHTPPPLNRVQPPAVGPSGSCWAVAQMWSWVIPALAGVQLVCTSCL